MWKGWPVISCRTRLTMMFGEVPTRVIRPPSREPNDIGIRNTEGEVPERFGIWKAAGIIMASAPIFLTKAERKVTEPTRTSNCEPACVMPLDSRATPASITPERSTAAEMTSARGDDDDDVVGEAGESAWRGRSRPQRGEQGKPATMS